MKAKAECLWEKTNAWELSNTCASLCKLVQGSDSFGAQHQTVVTHNEKNFENEQITR